MSNDWQQCNFCVMDTSDPGIIFDNTGQCNRCKDAIDIGKKIWFPNEEGKKKLDIIINTIQKTSKKNDYDCIVGISGGIDSAYLTYRLRRDYPSLRIFAIHVDGGWNSEISVKNIEVLVKKLNIDLYTHVVDWEEMQDLQLAVMKASVANQDIPQDHAFFAALYNLANSFKIKYFLTGGNYATECILPPQWGHSAMDLRHLKDIQKKFGTKKLKHFPLISAWKWYFYYPYIQNFKVIRPLNYMLYNKKNAKKQLYKELGWRNYGDKHHESVFTKFFQSYYLPKKFGYDKRKAHLSSLIVSNQIDRVEALEILKEAPYDENFLEDDILYMSKKLGISVDEFEHILEKAPILHSNYKTNNFFYNIKNRIKKMIK